ncbi:hypothetical protein DFH11DRAFT_1728146 [Phellopilus nigrolimitatus]|nr:hypothetical protein DFH11DRAFT_1728146 [Phellopilus nigrolimitatus]
MGLKDLQALIPSFDYGVVRASCIARRGANGVLQDRRQRSAVAGGAASEVTALLLIPALAWTGPKAPAIREHAIEAIARPRSRAKSEIVASPGDNRCVSAGRGGSGKRTPCIRIHSTTCIRVLELVTGLTTVPIAGVVTPPRIHRHPPASTAELI